MFGNISIFFILSDDRCKLLLCIFPFFFCKLGRIGLLLYGDVGTGKTYLAACIANALLNQGIRVKWLTSM